MADPVSSSPAGSAQQHRDAAPRSIRAAVVTISDTRTAETDESGNYLCERLAAGGHRVVERVIVPDDAVEIRSAVVRLMRVSQVVLTTGGTGITGRDVTVPVIESLLTKPIPGFGELFRTLSYSQVRGAAMLSRAVGGVGRGALVFAMPGSINAVKTGWEGILEQELGHLVYELTRQGQLNALGQLPPKEALFTDLPEPLPSLSEPPIPAAVPSHPVPSHPVSGPPVPGTWGGEFKGVDWRTPAGQTAASSAPGTGVAASEAAEQAPIKLGRHTQHATTYERTPLVRPTDAQLGRPEDR